MDRVGADFYRSVETIVDRLKCRPVPIQLPIGAEDQFKGIVDLVTMKARVWLDETLGAKFDEIEIPADMVEKAKEYHDKLVEAVSESDDHLFDEIRRRRSRSPKRNCAPGFARPPSRRRFSRWCAGRRSRTRACRICWMRWSIICLRRWMFRRSRAPTSTITDEADRAQGRTTASRLRRWCSRS